MARVITDLNELGREVPQPLEAAPLSGMIKEFRQTRLLEEALALVNSGDWIILCGARYGGEYAAAAEDGGILWLLGRVR